MKTFGVYFVLLVLVTNLSFTCLGKEMTKMPWQKHMGYFGSPEAYAREIQRKESTGESFSDPATAAAFKAAHPQYFSQPSSPAREAQRAADEYRNYQAETRMWEEKTFGKPAIAGPGGLSYEEQVQTYYITPEGEIVPGSIEKKGTLPTGGSSGGVYWTSPSGETAYFYTSPQTYQQPAFDPAKYVAAHIEPLFREYMALYESALSDASLAPVVVQAYEQVISTIEQAEATIRKQFEEQMGGVDPATQAALATLRETFRRQRQTMLEELSRRGLLQSGIWLEAEARLAQGQLTEEQRLLGNRLADLQTRLNQALQNFASQRIQAAQIYSLEGLRALEEEQKNREKIIAENLERAIQQAQWEAGQELQWYQAMSPYEMVPASERGIPVEQLADTYGYQLYQAQLAYRNAQQSGNRAGMAEAAARGQQIRNEAFSQGVTPEQLERSRLKWWSR